jgi:hypothetical protein
MAVSPPPLEPIVKPRVNLRILYLLGAMFGLWITTATRAANPTWLGRPFTKVLSVGDPIPGTAGATFGHIKYFTFRAGTLHIVAGENQSRNGLFRWRNGVLEKLVYTDTVAPNGSTFDTVHFATDETSGALNFVGEILFGRPGASIGLFEIRNGQLTRVFDNTSPVDGITVSSLGYPVRVGNQIVGGSNFLENGELRNGILKWDGSHLTKIIASGDDLPGSLGAFTGQPGPFQIDFDGIDVAFVATDHPQGRGTNGVYRTVGGGSLVKLVDGNDRHPSGRTYHERFAVFSSVAVAGTNQAVATHGGFVSSAGGSVFYTTPPVGLARFSNGTFDPALNRFGLNSGFQATITTNRVFDGRTLNTATWVDAEGDDLVYLLTFTDGSSAIYAAVAGGTPPPPTAPILTVPSVAGGSFMFQFPSVAGTSYRIEFQGVLGGAWTARQTLAGTGSDLTFSEPLATGGYYRVVAVP